MCVRVLLGWLLLLFSSYAHATAANIHNFLVGVGIDFNTILTLTIGAFIGIGLSAAFISVAIRILKWLKRAA
jgi:hypothetical protein